MVSLATVSTLERLEQEMATAGRTAEESALREARRALAQPRHGFITTGQAAERLGVSIPTVKRWAERGVLVSQRIGGRLMLFTESVDHHVRLRQVLREMDEEGNPTDEEIQEMYRRRREERERRHAG